MKGYQGRTNKKQQHHITCLVGQWSHWLTGEIRERKITPEDQKQLSSLKQEAYVIMDAPYRDQPSLSGPIQQERLEQLIDLWEKYKRTRGAGQATDESTIKMLRRELEKERRRILR